MSFSWKYQAALGLSLCVIAGLGGTKFQGRTRTPQPTAAAPVSPLRRSMERKAPELPAVSSWEQWALSVEPGHFAKSLEDVEQSVGDAALRSVIRALLLSRWADSNLAGMAAWLGSREPVDSLHEAACSQLVEALCDREPAEALSWMEKHLSEPLKRELYGPYFRRWLQYDPHAAIEMLVHLTSSSRDKEAFWNDLAVQSAGQWAQADLASALLWLRSLPESGMKSRALLQVSYAWATKCPVEAAAYAASRKEPALTLAVAATWAENEPLAALLWLEGQPAGVAPAINQTVALWAEKDLEKAAAHASSLPAGIPHTEACAAIVSVWAQREPRKAAAWVESLPEGSGRTRALAGLMAVWTGNGLEAPTGWLQTLPSNSFRDAAVRTFCQAAQEADPGSSFEWAKTISYESTRNEAMEEAARSWLARDTILARNAVLKSSLPEPRKRALLAGFPASS